MHAAPILPGMNQTYVYSMYRCNKFFGPERQVLRDISLSFLPGAKIGVLGPNGAGKSTLLRIMAGVDEPSNGEARLAPGATVGYLPQEPELDPAKDVRGNVEDGVAEKRALLDRFNEISARFAEPMSDDEMETLLEEQGEVQDRIDRTDAWSLDRMLDIAMDALRLPPGDAEVDQPLRRRAPPRRAVPAAALVARPAAARRADQPPRRRVGGVARALPGRVRGHGRRRHPRPLLPRQRRRLDPRARPRPRHPVPGQLLVVARAEAGAPGRRGEAGVGPPADARSASSSGCGWRRGRGTPRARRASPRTSSCWPRRPRSSSTRSRSTSRPGRGSATWSSRPTALRKGYGDRLLIDDLDFSLPRGRHRRRDRPERRRQDDALPHDRRPGAARRRRAARRPVGAARLRRPGPRRPRSRRTPSGRRSPAARTGSRSASARSPRAPTWRRSTSAAATSRSASATSPAASATGCTWPSSCARAATCCCSTSRPTTSTSTRCARSRTRCSRSPAARW